MMLGRCHLFSRPRNSSCKRKRHIESIHRICRAGDDSCGFELAPCQLTFQHSGPHPRPALATLSVSVSLSLSFSLPLSLSSCSVATALFSWDTTFLPPLNESAARVCYPVLSARTRNINRRRFVFANARRKWPPQGRSTGTDLDPSPPKTLDSRPKCNVRHGSRGGGNLLLEWWGLAPHLLWQSSRSESGTSVHCF